jgi:hypothetical protein
MHAGIRLSEFTQFVRVITLSKVLMRYPQDVQSASAGHQRDVAARLADVQSREVAVALREGFCDRLEAELAARVALLESQAAAAAARAVGAPPPDDMAAQATAALRILQVVNWTPLAIQHLHRHGDLGRPCTVLCILHTAFVTSSS